MSAQYWNVVNPTQQDKDESEHGNNSPHQVIGANKQLWLMKYTNGYEPSDGTLDYHAENYYLYEGKTHNQTGKVPSPFTIQDLAERGNKIRVKFLLSVTHSPVDRIKLFEIVHIALELLQIGDLAAARALIVSFDDTGDVFTASMKSTLLSDIDLALNLYPELKDAGVYTG